jgi:signal transduction histidine kinase
MLRSAPRLRAAWPLALLIGGLACIVLVLWQAQQSVRSNRALAQQALRGYSSFAAWSFEEHFSESIRVATQEVLGGVNMFHETLPIPRAGGLPRLLPRNPACGCPAPRFGPLPEAYLGFTLGTDTVGMAYNAAPPGTAGWLLDDPTMRLPATASGSASRLDPATQRKVVHELTQLARAPLPRWGYHFLVEADADSSLAFVLTRMPTRWGDTIVYAVQYSARAIDSLLAATFDDRDLVPGAIAVKSSNRELLDAEVRDAAGQILFASGHPAAWTLDAVTTLPASYGGLVIRMQVKPQLAGQLIIGGLPRSRLPLLLGLLTLAVGLSAIAVVQLGREARFARDRAAFVASASHELRTPLAQIRLVVDMLQLDREKDPQRRESALALVDREVTRLQHLVDTVLRFARGAPPAETGREMIDVVAEVRSVIAEFAPLAAARGISIVVAATGTPVVALRAGAMRQVLLNLLDNAVKYAGESPVITVSVAASGSGGMRLTVRDHGPGVPPGERSRIWGAFERGAAAAARAAGGSGIGLTVVRDIAEQHGGRAWVADTSSDDGAEFVIEIPGAA